MAAAVTSISGRLEQRLAGRELRSRVPRSAQGAWRPGADREDPLDLLEQSNRTRLEDLVPVRNGRMLHSPFTFYRGAPLVMASDLSRMPSTGIKVQVCGDAHLLNFGTFATPERNLVFDLNDFDETHAGPWEWDLKRLAASLLVAARSAGLTDADGVEAVHRCSTEYRARMSALAELTSFEVWQSRVDADAVVAAAPTKQSRAVVIKTVDKARQHTNLQALSKLTTIRDDKRVILEDPPLVVRVNEQEVEQAFRFARAYRSTLDPDRRLLLDRYHVVDAARKVVGVGSVGTRCYVVLLAGVDDLDPLFLQIKEAQASVLESYTGRSPFRNQGYRVVVGQRIMQAASDVFLGWARADGFDTYVRQLRDMKGSAEIETLDGGGLAGYGRLCGATLARAHARAGQPALLAAYLGNGPVFDDALAQFAVAYADQTERDYEAFVRAVRTGRFPAIDGR
ncbi:MAG TPA: DUF2252 domain-containing protein [Acidimicrobiales bacterium]|nr:DUF2252 domain-containing protein [Acidimicrobiales bacterium]